MSDEQALLAAILADPAEDTHRLVYADWLEEPHDVACWKCGGEGGWEAHEHWCGCGPCGSRGFHHKPNGQPDRAAFIRVQVELASLDPYHRSCTGSKCPTCSELRRRERELLAKLSLVALLGFSGASPGYNADRKLFWFVKGGQIAIEPTRGFVSRVACSWSDWHAHADAILARHPIERVKLTTMPQGHEWFFSQLWSGPERKYTTSLWPRIEFELPPERPWQRYADQYTDASREELVRRLREAADGHVFTMPIRAPRWSVRAAQ